MTDRAFAVFILTHGRPHDVVTFTTLRDNGYTGRIYLLVDNEDATVPTYVEKFGAENVIIFDKAEIAKTTDAADTTGDRRSTVFARNASFQIARDLGLNYFLQLDDDYKDFLYRFTNNNKYTHCYIKQMNHVFDSLILFLEQTNVDVVSFSQGGDHMGGSSTFYNLKTKRKAMNAMFMRTENSIKFSGRLNDDVNTYLTLGCRGILFLTLLRLQLNQTATQETPGGLTEVYRDGGTYVKSFYSVMMAPSCVSIVLMCRRHRRLHHRIQWNNAVPKIINELYCKTATR